MAPSSKCFFVLPLLLVLCNSVMSSDMNAFERRELDREKEQLFPSIHRTLVEYFRYKMTEFDSIDPPTTALPSPPITNPVTGPPVNTAPGIVTVPGANPVGVSPTPTTTTPVTNPVNPPVPVTNPVTTPSTNPGGTPTANPITTPSVMPPPTTSTGNAPAGRGQSWCVAKNGASQAALQSALDYACGIGGADCATIQQGSSCYEPTTLQNHASYAFNSYYQKNPVPTSCDFGGAATITTTNPSVGSCIFPSSSSSSSSSLPTPPTTQTPVNPTTQAPVNPTALPTPTSSSFPPPTTSSSGSTIPGALSPPPGFSFGNPDPTGLGAFGATPPLGSTASGSNGLRPIAGLLVASIMMFGA
ncbi:hypothetical protein LXL04_039090 [Taraxacum kok-saghyz]